MPLFVDTNAIACGSHPFSAERGQSWLTVGIMMRHRPLSGIEGDFCDESSLASTAIGDLQIQYQ
ncbi:MAG: hypothetical protein AAGA75_19870 [Cyanobacteria bacterium P01_E01_bin.6]